MATAITVDRVAKEFRIQVGGTMPGLAYPTLRDSLAGLARAPLRLLGRGGTASTPTLFRALDGVSFRIEQGEAVGIIGRNGAGKSTLLKILSRITRPTRGQAVIRGRVGSLLEIGTSFHPELTGRENIFLNGSILGMSRHEILRRFDAIVDFAEVEQFLDVPVKRYSSGMFIRLAMGVAAHLEPEVLLIDEVLAVGDAAFQKKCLGRMQESTTEGRTVVFVSHNMAALERLCTRAIWIDKGRVVADGPAGEVVSSYLRTSFAPATEQVWPAIEDAPGNAEIRVHRAAVRPRDGVPTDPISIRTPLVFEFDFWNLKPGARINAMLQLCNERGEIVFSSEPIKEPHWHDRPFPKALFRSTCEVPADLLNDGTHYVKLLFRQDEGLVLYEDETLLTLEVRDDVSMRGACNGKWPGVVRPDLTWTTRLLEESGPAR